MLISVWTVIFGLLAPVVSATFEVRCGQFSQTMPDSQSLFYHSFGFGYHTYQATYCQ
jgi:hypothetical protein